MPNLDGRDSDLVVVVSWIAKETIRSKATNIIHRTITSWADQKPSSLEFISANQDPTFPEAIQRDPMRRRR